MWACFLVWQNQTEFSQHGRLPQIGGPVMGLAHNLLVLNLSKRRLTLRHHLPSKVKPVSGGWIPPNRALNSSWVISATSCGAANVLSRLTGNPGFKVYKWGVQKQIHSLVGVTGPALWPVGSDSNRRRQQYLLKERHRWKVLSLWANPLKGQRQIRKLQRLKN